MLHARFVDRGSKFVRGLWAACLLVGGLNHARLLLRHGLFWDYGGVNPITAAYWSSLTLFDPLAAILLFVKPRLGIVSTIVLIFTNVAHNLAITAQYTPQGAFLSRAASNPFLVSQFAFMLFVAVTARIAWNGLLGGISGDRS